MAQPAARPPTAGPAEGDGEGEGEEEVFGRYAVRQGPAGPAAAPEEAEDGPAGRAGPLPPVAWQDGLCAGILGKIVGKLDARGAVAMSSVCQHWRRAMLGAAAELKGTRFVLLRRKALSSIPVRHLQLRGEFFLTPISLLDPSKATPRDLPAVLQAAGEAGNASALVVQANVATSFNMHREALKFWKRAAKLGAREAQAAYGEIMYRGQDGVVRDPEEALLWLTKAAKQGRGPGQGTDVALAQVEILLGFMYLDGDGTKEDPTEAIKWFKRASEHGNADAAKHMCYLYNTGQF